MRKSHQHFLIKLTVIAAMTALLRRSSKPAANKTVSPKHHDNSD
ncbi:hypothetical protein [Moraxella canis]|nr:hypothetical protein [Moraxella canis]